ncbi:hypothetical protein AB6C94_18950 [Vibrio splendidus]
MNTDKDIFLTQLLVDVKAAVFASKPKRYNGNAEYFSALTSRVLDTAECDSCDRTQLKSVIMHHLQHDLDDNGKHRTNFGYKRVLELVEKSFKYMNK